MRGKSTIVTSEIFSRFLYFVCHVTHVARVICACWKKKKTRRKKGQRRNSARPIFATGNVKSFGTTRLFSLLLIDIASRRCIHQYAHPFTRFLRVINVGYCSHTPWFISIGGDSTEIRRLYAMRLRDAAYVMTISHACTRVARLCIVPAHAKLDPIHR